MKTINNIHTLLIPDVHGRTFWKDAIDKFPKEQYPNLNIVFLGDYVDPYTQIEGITKEEALNNFKNILNVASNDNRIHLLIGNHDMHYWYDADYKCRVDKKNYKEIKSLFLKNFIKFNIAFEETINNEKYLYTHAGVTKQWLNHLRVIGKIAPQHNKNFDEEQIEYCKMLENFEPNAKCLNQLKINFQGHANLWMVSWNRGGDDICGSCIWEDLSEWFYKGTEIPGMWQIFGHSWASKNDLHEAYIDYDRKFACIDSARAWAITNDGKLEKIT